MKDSKQRLLKLNLVYILFAILGVVLIRDLWVDHAQIANIPYSEFKDLLAQGKITEVFVSDTFVQGKSSEKLEGGRDQFMTVRVDPAIAQELSDAKVKFTQVVENTFIKDLLSWVVPALVFFLLWFFIVGRLSKGGMGGGLMSIGKSRAKIYVQNDTRVRFDDVAGVEEAKVELVEIVNFLKDPKKFTALGARIPKGVLLVGPPGTGKTMLAKAVAGEAQVPFFSISGSEFVEMFVGVGAARVRDLFEQARQKSPCIIFIDELDALGRSRSGMGMGGHDEKEQTLNQLLVELDGFDTQSGLVLLSATNRPEILDPALLRSGRFDRQVLVDKPDRQGRLQILKVHVKKVKIAENVDFEKVAGLTPGFTGADIENFVNEAALVATRRKADAVTQEDFTNAMERIVAGLEKKNRVLNENERKIVAYHEMGHALVSAGLPGMDPVHKVSIIPRGIGSLGYTIQRPTEDRFLMTKQELENKMGVLLGGRAAEKLVFGHLSTGASDDISRATNIAREMVTRYGMDQELGSVTYDDTKPTFLGNGAYPGGSKNYSNETAEKIDMAVKALVEKAFELAAKVLTCNREVLEESATALIAKETLSEDDLKTFFARVQPA